MENNYVPINSNSDESSLRRTLVLSEPMQQFNWEYFLNYVQTYNPAMHGGNRPITILLDMLYGLGVSIDETYKYAFGFDAFKKTLASLLNQGETDERIATQQAINQGTEPLPPNQQHLKQQ